MGLFVVGRNAHAHQEEPKALADFIEQIQRVEPLSLKRNIRGLRDFQHGLVAGFLFPGCSDGFDLCGVFRCLWVVDDQHLRADALGCFLVFALPLPVDIHHAEAVGKARGLR